MNERSLPLAFLLIAWMFAVVPHLAHLPIWVAVTSLGMVIWWLPKLRRTSSQMLSRRIMLAMLLVALAATWWEYQTLIGREPGVALLSLFTGLKLLEVRSRRDAWVQLYLTGFLLFTAVLFSQSLWMAVLLVPGVWALLLAWLALVNPETPWQAMQAVAGRILLQAVPLALLLFLLFPRISGPLWGSATPEAPPTRSGLSDTMTPGSLSELSLSSDIAFRVKFNSPAPTAADMYWRGPVLTAFDGHTWQSRGSFRAGQADVQFSGAPVDYTVTLEPHQRMWLFALELPEQLSITALMSSRFELLNPTPVSSRLEYTAHSRLHYRANVEESPRRLQRALELPEGLNPQARALAQSWRKDSASDAAIVDVAMQYFHAQPFRYTLKPVPLGANEVDDFLFQSRQGFCEHYASAFVFLMRAAGVPARVVTGYQGGEFNATGGYWIVRQSDAHAWAEVWLAGQGWQRIDPVALVAPERVQHGLEAAIPQEDSALLPHADEAAWQHALQLRLDALNHGWDRWVLAYSPEQQKRLLSDLLTPASAGTPPERIWAMLGALGLLAYAVLFRLRQRATDPTQAAWLRFCEKLARIQLPRADHEGAGDYAERVAQIRPDLALVVRAICQQYQDLRYGTPPDIAYIRRFERAIRAFKPSRQMH